MTLRFAVVCLTIAALAPCPPASAAGDATTAQVCAPHYAREHRHVPRYLRDQIYTRYGIPRGQRRPYVIDHRVPLELGGTNDPSNLFPQPPPEAKRKDRDESRLHDAVCSGVMSLAAAQAEIRRLWAR